MVEDILGRVSEEQEDLVDLFGPLDPEPPALGLGTIVLEEEAGLAQPKLAGPAEYRSPPATTSKTPTTWTSSSCENATAPTHPSKRPIAAESHFGARTQKSFNTIAASAALQTTDSTGTAHLGDITSKPNGTYVPAISRYTPA